MYQLTAKNIQCMRTLLNLAHCHGAVLGTSWQLVLATLQVIPLFGDHSCIAAVGFSEASYRFLQASSVDPGVKARGGWRPEAWQSCGRTQYGE